MVLASRGASEPAAGMELVPSAVAVRRVAHAAGPRSSTSVITCTNLAKLHDSPVSSSELLGVTHSVQVGPPLLAYQIDYPQFSQTIHHLLRQLSPDTYRL